MTARPSLLRRWLTINDVTTGESAAYPELEPRWYEAAPAVAFATARAVCDDVPRVRVVREDGAARTIDAEHRTALIRFVDDVTIRVVPDSGGSHVTIRSHSRLGRGDFGQNARTIRALQAAMDRRLGR